MAAATQTPTGLLSRLFGTAKPAKPNGRGNAAAFKAGQRAFEKKGASADLRRAVMMSFENEARSQK